MNKPMLLLLATSLWLGGVAYPQAQAPPDPGAAATPGTTNPSKSDPSTATPGVVSPSPAATAGNLSAGMSVESPAGEAIGTVKDIVPDPRTGRPGYILITARSGAKTAIPYSTIAPMFRNGRVILDRSRLEGAPRISNSQLRNPSDHEWQRKAQEYWNETGPK